MLENSFAKNTLQSYTTGLNSFDQFRSNYELPKSWPPTIEQVSTYVSWLSLQGLSHNTARLYVNAIGFQCKMKDVKDITRHFIIQKVLEGLKRSMSVRQSRLPITGNILLAILKVLPSVCSNLYESYLFSAAYCLAFAAFLRISELAVSNKRYVSSVLSLADTTFCKGESVTICIRYSKTDQYGQGSFLKVLKSSSIICAVANLERYLERRPPVSGPLFCHLGGDPLTRYQFSSVLKKCLAILNLDYYGKFTSHSFRIGSASHAAMLGYSDEAIKQAGRWRSEAYRLYIKPDHVLSLPTLS